MVGVRSLCHDQRDAILPAFPILQGRSFLMSAEAVGREIVCEPPGEVRGLGERPAALTTDGDRPVGNDLGDHVQDRAYGPTRSWFRGASSAHAAEPTLTSSRSNALSRITFRMSASLKTGQLLGERNRILQAFAMRPVRPEQNFVDTDRRR